MVQPQYSPQEALERVKLMMKYDMSKTLNENKQSISEQYVAPTVAGTAAGAGIGAAIGSALPTSVAIGAAGTGAAGTGAASALVYSTAGALGVGLGTAGAIVGGAAALAVLPLVYWLATKDTGANKVKKMFQMCSSDAAKIAKLPRKMTDTTFRDMSDNIEDAINDTTLGIKGGTDEEKLFAQFKQLQDGTASDFCAFVAYYNSHSDSGDLFDDLDSDIDSEDEWKQIYRPIRNCVEDSLLTIKDEAPKGDTKTDGGKKSGTKPVAIPPELKDVKAFQDWLDVNAKGWATGYKEGIINKGQNGGGYGKFGPRTQKAWAKYKDQFLKGGTKTEQPTTTPPVKPEEIEAPDNIIDTQNF